ncbi:hypothetical protein [Bosea sp. PAMC 26642]|uniref:hypothetical protein n=1 Tax=Bosea sp. (strain PAMC 26642) TaxID=1792307 RepID=UPI00083666CD|nr:hypothetical protein [Bosea sp. PAMC 26642]
MFAWADAQPVASDIPEAPAKVRRAKRKPVPAEPAAASTREPAPVVDFLTKRPTLARWILGGRRDLIAFDLWFARKEGEIPPAPILPFAPRGRPPDPGGDGAPLSRVG